MGQMGNSHQALAPHLSYQALALPFILPLPTSFSALPLIQRTKREKLIKMSSISRLVLINFFIYLFCYVFFLKFVIRND